MKKILIVFGLIIFLFWLCAKDVTAVQTQKRWANPKRLNTYIQPGLERTGMMKRAFAEWSRYAKNNIVFYYVDSLDSADIDVVFVETLPDVPPGVIGLTRCTYNQKNQMAHATIYIPAKRSNGMPLNRDAVYTSMLHEIGHAMGIVRHSTNPQNIMYPYIDEKREISKFDLAELYRIYGWRDTVKMY